MIKAVLSGVLSIAINRSFVVVSPNKCPWFSNVFANNYLPIESGTERQTLRHNSESMLSISSRMACFKASMVWGFFGVDFVLQNAPQKEIGRRQVRRPRRPLDGPIKWPPRSPDLTPPDFFLWGVLKDKVYAKKNPNHRRYEAGHSWRNWKHWLWIMPQSLSLGTLATAKLHRGRWSPNGNFLGTLALTNFKLIL